MKRLMLTAASFILTTVAQACPLDRAVFRDAYSDTFVVTHANSELYQFHPVAGDPNFRRLSGQVVLEGRLNGKKEWIVWEVSPAVPCCDWRSYDHQPPTFPPAKTAAGAPFVLSGAQRLDVADMTYWDPPRSEAAVEAWVAHGKLRPAAYTLPTHLSLAGKVFTFAECRNAPHANP